MDHISITYLTGTAKFVPPTYNLTTRRVWGGIFRGYRNEHELLGSNGLCIGGLDDKALAIARMWLTIN